MRTLSIMTWIPKPVAGASLAVVSSLAAAAGFALLTGLGAHIKVFLPGNPVPLTLQTYIGVNLIPVICKYHDGIRPIG